MHILLLRDTETIRYAAEELVKYIRIMSDCDIIPEIHTDAEKAGDKVIRLGYLSDLTLDESDLTDPFVEDILDIQIQDGAGYIAGSNGRSVLMAVYKFCYSAGCRFIRPGEGGDYIPAYTGIGTHSYTYRKKADQPFRGECTEGAVSYEHMRDTVYWMPKVGMNMYMIEGLVPYDYMHRWYGHVGNTARRLKGQLTDYYEMDRYVRRLEMDIKKTGIQLHTLGHGWMFQKLGVHQASGAEEKAMLREEDKQYLALVNGVRDICHGSAFYTHFCYSNPAARKILVDFVLDYVKERPYVDFIHLWLADAANNQCECEDCVKLTPSDHYVVLLNEIDEALRAIDSEARLVFILYVDTQRPPEIMRLKHPERFVLLAALGADYSTPYHTEPYEGEIPPFVRNQFKPESKPLRMHYHRTWKELSNNINSIIFEYRFYTDQYCDPGYMQIARETFRDMKLLPSISFQGAMNDQTHRMAIPTALPLSLMGETLFDMNLDFEAFTDAYFEGAFGEYGAATRKYLETLSDLFCPSHIRASGKNVVENQGLDGKNNGIRSWLNNPEVAEKLSQIPGILDDFAPVITRNMAQADACRRRSWVNLMYHANICRLLCDLYWTGAKHGAEAAREKFPPLEKYLARVEMDIHPDFDVFLFLQSVRLKLGMGGYIHYD